MRRPAPPGTPRRHGCRDVYARGEKAQAREEVTGLLARVPRSVPVLLLKARLDAADGKLDDALASVQAAKAADPTSPDAVFLEGQVHAISGDTKKAVEAFE